MGLAVASQAGLFSDNFSSDPRANITSTVILDANGGGANTASLGWSSGALTYDTTTYDGIEQAAHIYSGVTLDVGEEVQVDIDNESGNQDFGVYVGGSAPVYTGGDSRAHYVNVYARDSGQVLADRFTSSGATFNDFQVFGIDYRKLFIARTGTYDYELGYYEGAALTRVVAGSLLGATDIDGSYVGFYTDVRAAGSVGTATGLEVIPEPATIGLIGVFGAGLLFMRRHFKI